MSDLKIKVGMLILLESDLESAVDFYKKIGLELKFHLKEKWAEFSLGPVKIGLCPTTQQSFDRHSGIVLEVNDIGPEHIRFTDKGFQAPLGPARGAPRLQVIDRSPTCRAAPRDDDFRCEGGR